MFEPPANSVQTGLIWQQNYLIGCLRAQTLAAIECGRINDSLGGSSVQAPGQLYTSWTCYKTTGTIPAAIERGLCLAWTTRWIKKWWHLRTANWTCHRQLPDSIEQCIYLEFLKALAQICAAIAMYCGVTILPMMLIGSNPKKNEDPVAFAWRQLWILNFGHGGSHHVKILRMSENLWLLWKRIYGKFSSKDRQILM